VGFQTLGAAFLVQQLGGEFKSVLLRESDEFN